MHELTIRKVGIYSSNNINPSQMKKITFLIFITLITMATLTQSRATSVSYNKETRPAIMLELPYTEEIAEGTIVQKLKEIGYDPETKGALFWKKNTAPHCK